MFLFSKYLLTTSFIEWLIKWDKRLFLQINTQWTNSFLDSVFPLWRDQTTWYYLYYALLAFLIIKFRWKCWVWVLFAIITISLTDIISSHLFKEWFDRLRPCREPELAGRVRLLLGSCPNGQSFTSSHAANHFGMAVFFFLTLKQYFKKWALLFFVWAASISYAQIYVGVHYPLDVIGGTITGCLIGWMTTSVFLKKIGMPKEYPLFSAKHK